MWYLIVPPIIVVLSLAFLLWYLSRKAKDPNVTARISDFGEEAGEKIAFSRTRTFLLRLLEKTTQRFKIVSLKMHNRLNDMTQSLREKRQKMQKKESVPEYTEETPEETTGVSSVDASSSEPVSEVAEEKEKKGFFSRFRMRREGAVAEKQEAEAVETEVRQDDTQVSERETPAAFRRPASDDSLVAMPIIRRRRQSEEVSRPSGVSVEEERPVRPMVSEAVAQPEVRRGKPAPVSPVTTRRNGVSREEDLIANIAANPKDFSAYEALGDYYLEMNNVKDAKECYRQVLKLSPVHRMVKIKIRRLEKLLTQKVG